MRLKYHKFIVLKQNAFNNASCLEYSILYLRLKHNEISVQYSKWSISTTLSLLTISNAYGNIQISRKSKDLLNTHYKENKR